VIPALSCASKVEAPRWGTTTTDGSSKSGDSVVGSLTALHLLDKFDTLVCAEDYTHGKPAPDCFLLAAERLGVEPASCLVFEDTELGIEAATAAGMASVRVPQIKWGTESLQEA